MTIEFLIILAAVSAAMILVAIDNAGLADELEKLRNGIDRARRYRE